MAQDYVRPPFPPDGSLEPDRVFFRDLGPSRLWIQWRGQSRKFITVTFLVARVPDGGGPVSARDLEIVDVSHSVARLTGSLIDTQGGARLRLVESDVVATVADAAIRTSEQVWGAPDGFIVSRVGLGDLGA